MFITYMFALVQLHAVMYFSNIDILSESMEQTAYTLVVCACVCHNVYIHMYYVHVYVHSRPSRVHVLK